jgi:quinolinate synthase
MSEILAEREAPTLEGTESRMRSMLEGIVPSFEIAYKAELAYEINKLKKLRNAVILGHNYMEPALYHSVPDYTGDSLALASASVETDADIILFCGVQFMAETAKILNPEKTVLIPSQKAGCSLAEGITAEQVRHLRDQFPGAPVVTYVNSYADVKAESDYCCTSGNAEKVVRHLLEKGHKQIIFLPDEYLAHNTAKELGLSFFLAGAGKDPATAPKECLIGWNARCEVHEQFTVEDVQSIRVQFPDVTILAHPECSPEVIGEVDFQGSTKQMVDYVAKTDAQQLLLLTECSMGDNIAAEYPEKDMLRLCSIRCPHMNHITLEDTLAALQHTQYEVNLPAEHIERGRLPIERMLSIH